MDDIPIHNPASETESAPGPSGAPPAPPRRRVGPESEDRGGPEAPDGSITSPPA